MRSDTGAGAQSHRKYKYNIYLCVTQVKPATSLLAQWVGAARRTLARGRCTLIRTRKDTYTHAHTHTHRNFVCSLALMHCTRVIERARHLAT